MSIRTTALLMMIGIAGTFVIRTANSIWPWLYESLQTARLMSLLLLVASLFTLFFFWSVQSAWAESGRSRLEAASRLATVGAALAVLVALRNVLGLFRAERVPLARMEDLEAFVSLISMLAMFWFFYAVHAELRGAIPGTGGALVGAALFAFAALLTLLLHILPAPPRWLAMRSTPLVLLSLPLGLLAVLGVLRFLASVRRQPEAMIGTR